MMLSHLTSSQSLRDTPGLRAAIPMDIANGAISYHGLSWQRSAKEAREWHSPLEDVQCSLMRSGACIQSLQNLPTYRLQDTSLRDVIDLLRIRPVVFHKRIEKLKVSQWKYSEWIRERLHMCVISICIFWDVSNQQFVIIDCTLVRVAGSSLDEKVTSTDNRSGSCIYRLVISRFSHHWSIPGFEWTFMPGRKAFQNRVGVESQ